MEKSKTIIKKIGIWGFAFFLLKGLVWLALAFFAGKSIF